MRILGSIPLLAVYLLGGFAGDDRGPILPLERQCPSCGRRFKGRSVFDTVRGWTSGSHRVK